MTVYVDEPKARLGRMKMCHMVADTSEELYWMAYELNLNTLWLQHPRTYQEHYDLALGVRAKAVALGAVELTTRELVRYIVKRGVPPDPQGRWMESVGRLRGLNARI